MIYFVVSLEYCIVIVVVLKPEHSACDVCVVSLFKSEVSSGTGHEETTRPFTSRAEEAGTGEARKAPITGKWAELSLLMQHFSFCTYIYRL